MAISSQQSGGPVDIVVKSRHVEVSDRFRSHAEEKLSRLEKHDQRVIRVEVEIDKERNPRQHDRAVRVQLTAFSKGPVIRAEAAAEDKMSALDIALDKMASQMRRAADRRRVHHGRHTPVSVGQALAGVSSDSGSGTPSGMLEEETERQVGQFAQSVDIGRGSQDEGRPVLVAEECISRARLRQHMPMLARQIRCLVRDADFHTLNHTQTRTHVKATSPSVAASVGLSRR